MPNTTFEDQCGILAELWMDYRNEEDFKPFIDFNDVGLPLAYILHEGIVKKSKESIQFISETFDLLLGVMEIEDQGFNNLEDVFKHAIAFHGLVDNVSGE